MQHKHIAGYKFIALTNLDALRTALTVICQEQALLGTILLSNEGINISLAGSAEHIVIFQTFLTTQPELADIRFHETWTTSAPYQLLKVKIKPEIITMHLEDIDAVTERAASISPQTLKTWLDEKHDFTLLDTRNDYEVKFGTFKAAAHLNIRDFGEFPETAVRHVNKNKPVVMFCTGGIRCEKAAIYMQKAGYKEVYQLDRGILGYFAEVGGAHWEGECFVFDDRVALNSQLQETGTRLCKNCQGPVPPTSIDAHQCN